jgi:peptidoglycan hydrolase-like protein with peptidoglycan-binding domain
MDIFSRKAVLGVAAALTAASAASMTAGAAMAAPATPAAAAARALPATTCFNPVPLSWPLVVQGNTGFRVVDIQYLLNQQIGAGLAPDGIFGPLTASAVRHFQAICGIAVDGKVGNQTWPRLTVQVQFGSTGSAVRAVQQNLNVFGADLAVDGIFGPLTQAAVRHFQATHGLVVDGSVGPRTWNTLVVNEPASAFNISLQAISPNPTTPGTATNVTVDFKNIKSTTASNVTLVIKVLNSAGTVVGSQSWTGQNVAPQQTLNETYTWTAAPAGTYTVEGLVQDSSGKTLQQAQAGTITVN